MCSVVDVSPSCCDGKKISGKSSLAAAQRYRNQRGGLFHLVFSWKQTSPFSLPLIFVLKPGSGATKKNRNGILGVKLRSLEAYDSVPWLRCHVGKKLGRNSGTGETPG